MRSYFVRLMASPRVCVLTCWALGKAQRDSCAAIFARRAASVGATMVQYVEGGTRPRRKVFTLNGRRWKRTGSTTVLAPGSVREAVAA